MKVKNWITKEAFGLIAESDILRVFVAGKK